MRSNARCFAGAAGIAVILGAVSLCLPEESRAQQTGAVASSIAVDSGLQLPDSNRQLTLRDLAGGGIQLTGVQPSRVISVGTRGDEVVTGATLHLRMMHSPSLLPELSHLRVSVNGEPVVAIALSQDQSGREIERDVVLDPALFSDYTTIGLELIGHYLKGCEDPHHSGLWVNVAATSALELSARRLELANDLGLLPAPFFDRRDNRRLVLPVVLPPHPSRDVVRSAGIAASWFGGLADYRGARFPVSLADLPRRHSLVFATNAARPGGLDLPEVQQPTLRVVDHPADSAVKLLVFQGKDDAQLRQSVEGLVIGHPVLTGSVATVGKVEYAPRVAYDNPRWLQTQRETRLGELIDTPEQLQSQGVAPEPLRIALRLPPDLFTWNHDSVPVVLRYRYTAPLVADESALTVSLNRQLLRTYHLRPESESKEGRILVPLRDMSNLQQSESFSIPAFQLANNKKIEFQLSLARHTAESCSDSAPGVVRQAIDPDSTIDLSGFGHYTALPNLALFANAGYPFSRFADLSQTAIVLENTESRDSLEQLFFVLGRFARHTGVPTLRFELLDVDSARQSADKDLLLLSGPGTNALAREWGASAPIQLGANERRVRNAAIMASVTPYRRSPAEERARENASAEVQAQGSVGAIVGFESPLRSARSVVALLASDAAGARGIIDALDDESKVPLIRGSVAVVRSGHVESFQGSDTYYVGALSWWRLLWYHTTLHPVLLTLGTLALAIIMAMWAYGWLQRRAAARMRSAKL